MYRPRFLLEWRMRRSDRDEWYELERMYAAWGSPYGSFLDFVPIALLTAQQIDPAHAKAPFAAIAQRDRGCTNPACTSRDCAAHHIRFRSKGGTDDGWNLTGLDTICHLELVHTERSLTVTGRAPDHLTWQIGPRDIGMTVIGRRLVLPRRNTRRHRPRSASAAT